MSNSMDNLNAKFSAISLREQKLVFYAVPFVICFVFILGLIEPAITQTLETRNEINTTKLRLVDVSNSVDSVQAQLNLDPNIDIKNQIAAVNRQIQALDKQFASELEQLVPPRAMPLVLEQLFFKAKKLKLVSMTTVAPSNIFASNSAANATSITNTDFASSNNAATGPELFKHGLRISFEGSFFDTRDFLMSAEQMDWKLHWQEIRFDVTDYPKATVDIELFTLSDSKAYIHVN